MINPAEIPQIPGDMGALGQHAAAVTGLGTAFPDTGRRVHTTWQGLAPVYTAPESAQLFAATGPVQSITASVGQDFSTVGAALSTYATEVAAIKTRLETLRAQATTFVDTVGSTEDWRENEDDVNRHNQLLSDVNVAVADFMDSQRRCANSILALYSDKRYVAENGDGTIADNEFGYTSDMLDAVLAQDEALPWGGAEEHDRGFLGDVGAFFVGIKDGAVDMVKGLGALIGYADGEWSWATAGAAWKGLGTFALALSPVLLALNATTDLPGLPRGTLHTTLLGAGKALIAYDTWGEDKSKAAGMVTFNVVSAIIGTKGAGAALRGGGTAAQASRFATVAKVGAGAVRAGEFVAKLPSVSDVVLGAVRKFPGFHVPHIDIPNADIPPTHVDTPSAPRADVPSTPAGSSPTIGDAIGAGERRVPPAATLTPDGVADGRAFDPPSAGSAVDAPAVRDPAVDSGRGTADAPSTPAQRPAEVPAHVGATQQAPAHVGAPQQAPAHVGAPQQAPVHVGAPQQAPAHVGAPEQAPAGGGHGGGSDVDPPGGSGDAPGGHGSDSSGVGDGMPGNAASGNDVPGNDVAGNDVAGNDLPGNGPDANGPDGNGTDGNGTGTHEEGSAPHRELTPDESRGIDDRRADVVGRNPERYEEWSYDPDHHGKVNPNSLEEAATLLDMHERGTLPDDVRRPTDSAGGDGVSGSPPNEIHYDIKHEHDEWPAKANKPPGTPFTPAQGAYSTATFETKLTKQIVRLGRVVVIDTRGLKQATIDDMHNLVAKHGWENDVIWYP